MWPENPYRPLSPIRDAGDFYGRARESAYALQMLENGQSLSVIGPHRIGKTSFLLHLADPAVRNVNGLRSRERLAVYLDGKVLGGLAQAESLLLMLRETAALSGAPMGSLSPPADVYAFVQSIRALVRPEQRLVFLLDDFESLLQTENPDARFLSLLRRLTVHFSIVTATQEPLSTVVQDQGPESHFFNVFEPVRLGLFGEKEARRMIQEPFQAAGVRYSRELEDLILDLAGPHPLLLQLACFAAFDLASQGRSLNAQTLAQLADSIRADLEPHFAPFIQGLGSQERCVLARLLDGDQSMGGSAAMEALEHKCLVRRREGKRAFVSSAFAEFVRRRIGSTWAAAISEGERRMATVLFADIVGFTSMSERHTPEQVLSIIKPAVRMFVDVADRHGGEIAAFGGDSVTALFGVPIERPNDAVRAVRAALEIQASIARYARELGERERLDFSARVGLDTGVVAVGEVGGARRTEFTAYGDAVNLAQRMQVHAEPGTIVISDRTFQQVGGCFETEPLGEVQVKGKSQPVRAHRVLGEAAQAADA